MLGRSEKKVPSVAIFLVMLPYIARTIEESLLPTFTILTKSITFYAFFVFLIGTLIYNYNNFFSCLYNKVIVAGFFFILACFLIEFNHTNSMYEEATKTFFMFAAVPLYASWVLLYKKTIKYILISFFLYAIVHAVNVDANINLLQMIAVGNSDEIREMVEQGLWFYTNLNSIAYTAGTAMVICYLLMKNTSSSFYKGVLFILILGFLYTLVTCFSRSAFVNVGIIAIFMLIRYRPKINYKVVIPVLILCSLISFGPIEKLEDAIIQRFSTIEIGNADSQDSRSKLYTIVIKYIPEVFPVGVGAGNYFGHWGLNTELLEERYDQDHNLVTYRVGYTHNSFTQILFFWGIIAVVLYVIMLWELCKIIPPRKDTSIEAKITAILFISTFSLIIFTNNWNYKEFTLAYGLLLGLYMRRKFKLVEN